MYSGMQDVCCYNNFSMFTFSSSYRTFRQSAVILFQAILTLSNCMPLLMFRRDIISMGTEMHRTRTTMMSRIPAQVTRKRANTLSMRNYQERSPDELRASIQIEWNQITTLWKTLVKTVRRGLSTVAQYR